MYAPTLTPKTGQLSHPSYIARKHFFNFIGDNLQTFQHNIVVGDFYNIPDYYVDKIWTGNPPNNPDIEDMTPFNTNFIHKLDLMDTYMNSYDEQMGPVAMTYMSTKGTSYSRLDRIYNSSSLYEYAWVHHVSNRTTDVNPLTFQTDHYPVSISLIETSSFNIKQYKTWKLNVNTFLQPANLEHINKLSDDIYKEVNIENAIEKYEKFKRKVIRYMKTQQANSHKIQTNKKKKNLMLF